MLIANPIYDIVFKYLMENLDIAKGVISTIIDEEIDHLDFTAQENIRKDDEKLNYYHLDFIARIRKKEGGYKNVLIELQKTNVSYDIMRFRRYLGEQYRKEDENIQRDGTISQEPLPIITIYFLGFYLSRTLPAVVKVNRYYLDVLSGEKIEERNDFIECLTHDSFVIQIPALHVTMRSRLERVLSIFAQENFVAGDQRLKSYGYKTDDELMVKILKQLEKAAADNEMLRQLELEEMATREYQIVIGKYAKKLQEKDRELKEKHRAIEEKNRAIEEKERTIEKKNQAIEAKERALEEKNLAIAEQERHIKKLMEKLKKLEPS